MGNFCGGFEEPSIKGPTKFGDLGYEMPTKRIAMYEDVRKIQRELLR